MAEMGKYCKAYYAKDFRAFEGWEENLDNLRPETKAAVQEFLYMKMKTPTM